jgi:hypothetical protein
VQLQPPPGVPLQPDRIRRTVDRIARELGRDVPVLVGSAVLAGPAGPRSAPVDFHGRPAPAVWATRWEFHAAGTVVPPAETTGPGVLAEVLAAWAEHQAQGLPAREFPKLDAGRARQLLDEVGSRTVAGDPLNAAEVLPVREALAPKERVSWVLGIGELIDLHPEAATLLDTLQRNIVWCADVAPNHVTP